MRRATVSFDLGPPLAASDVDDVEESQPRFDRYIGLLHDWNGRSSHTTNYLSPIVPGTQTTVAGRTGECLRCDTGVGLYADGGMDDVRLEIPAVQVGPSWPQPELGALDACIFRGYLRIPEASDLPRTGVDAVILSLAPTTNSPAPINGVTRPLLEVGLTHDARLVVRQKTGGTLSSDQQWVDADETPDTVFIRGAHYVTEPGAIVPGAWYCLEAAVVWGTDDAIAAVRVDHELRYTRCTDRSADALTGRHCAFVGWGRTYGDVGAGNYSPGDGKRLDWDDVALNDLAGDQQNTWAGPGNVRVTRPTQPQQMFGDYYGWARGDERSLWDGMMNGTSGNVLKDFPEIEYELAPGVVPDEDGYQLGSGLGGTVDEIPGPGIRGGDWHENEDRMVTEGASDLFGGVGAGPAPGSPTIEVRASRSNLAWGLDDDPPPGPDPVTPHGFEMKFAAPVDVVGPVAVAEVAVWTNGYEDPGTEPAPGTNLPGDPHTLQFTFNPAQPEPTAMWNDPPTEAGYADPPTGLENVAQTSFATPNHIPLIFQGEREYLPDVDPLVQTRVTLLRHNARRTYGRDPYDDITRRFYGAMAVTFDDGYVPQDPLPPCEVTGLVAIGAIGRGARARRRITGRLIVP